MYTPRLYIIVALCQGQRWGFAASKASPSTAPCCVPGKARLLHGDDRYSDTWTGQSPDPAHRRSRRRGRRRVGVQRKREPTARVSVASGNGSRRQASSLKLRRLKRVCQQCTPEGGRRQKRGSTNRYAPHRKVEGRQMRRGTTGTNPQHRIKSSIRYMVYHVYLTIVR